MFSRSSNKFKPKQFSDRHCVGFTKSAHGIRGEVFVKLYAAKADWLGEVVEIYLLEPGQTELSTWPIEFKRPHKEGLILKLKTCDDRNRAEELRKSGVYIASSLLVAKEGEAIFLKQILDFEVLDRTLGAIGFVRGFATNGAQDLLRVERPQGEEALVPYVEAFLVNIDFDKRQVNMDLPPGLLELEDE